jgi:hypothetical protein
LRRPPSACAGRRRADQIPRGLAPRTDRGRASTPQGRSPRHRSEHHGEAPRQPRAHLAVDARASEGARRGAARSPCSHSRSRWRRSRRRGKGRSELGFRRRDGEGFLFRRDARAAVDRDRTVEVDPRATGPLLAQAGRKKGGPGPGCLARKRERPRVGARGDAGRVLAGRARA